MSLQKQLQDLQEAIQSASEAWSAPSPTEVDATAGLAEAQAQNVAIREEADGLMQRAEAAEQVCTQNSMH